MSLMSVALAKTKKRMLRLRQRRRRQCDPRVPKKVAADHNSHCYTVY